MKTHISSKNLHTHAITYLQFCLVVNYIGLHNLCYVLSYKCARVYVIGKSSTVTS